MPSLTFAFYKGPPRNDWWHTVSHYAIRLWNLDKWSHAELVIDGVCWSSSARDGGIRDKVIDLNSGRWDLVDFPVTQAEREAAHAFFRANKGRKYDWAGILRFVFPFLPHSKSRRFCFEALGDALGLAGTYKLTAKDLFRWAEARQANNPIHEVWE